MGKTEGAMDIARAARKQFPILGSRGQATVDWQLVADHGKQAYENHRQTVARLAERGGLSWCELHAVLHDRVWQKMEPTEAMLGCREAEAKYLAAVLAADRITALEAELAEAKAEVERLAGAWKLQHKEKMKERAEAKLWFGRAQGWRAELTALEAMCETLAGFAKHDSDCVLGIPKAIRSRSSIQEECTCGLDQALTEWRDQHHGGNDADA